MLVSFLWRDSVSLFSGCGLLKLLFMSVLIGVMIVVVL